MSYSMLDVLTFANKGTSQTHLKPAVVVKVSPITRHLARSQTRGQACNHVSLSSHFTIPRRPSINRPMTQDQRCLQAPGEGRRTFILQFVVA